MYIERLLTENTKLLKDPQSPYWAKFTEVGIHQEPGHPDTFVESDGGFLYIQDNIKETPFGEKK